MASSATVFGATGGSPRTLTCASSSTSRRTAFTPRSFRVVEDGVDDLRGDAVGVDGGPDQIAAARHERERERPAERDAVVARGDVAEHRLASRLGDDLGPLGEPRVGEQPDELLAVWPGGVGAGEGPFAH